jgi:hypothetical protein
MTEKGSAVDESAGDRADDSGRAYSGVFGTFPYAFRNSRSWLFKLYVPIGGVIAAFVVVQFVISLTVTVSNTLGTAGGTFTFSRAFIVLIGFLVLVPIIAPVLLFARRHRLQAGSLHPRYDQLVAVGGFVFLFALYVGLVASIPECFEFGETTTCRPEPSGVTAPAVRVLYDLPPVAGLAPPVVAGVGIYLLDRFLR